MERQETQIKKCINGATSNLDTGGGTGAFDDTADPVVLNTTTKDVVIGTSQVNTSKLSIDGDADQVQLTIQCDATQTDSCGIMENSAGTEVINLEKDGDIKAQSIQDIDGPGTNWSITAAGAATFISVGVGSAPNPKVELDDDATDDTVDSSIDAQATEAGAGIEDVDVTYKSLMGGTLTTYIQYDADNGTEDILKINVPIEVDATDPADSGAIRLDNAENVCWESAPAGTDVCLGATSGEIIVSTGGLLEAEALDADALDAMT